MAHVMILHESDSTRNELKQALQAEGFTVGEAATTSDAVREIWDGSYDAVLFNDRLPNVGGASIEEHLRNLAPEIVTLAISKEPPGKLARKLADILDGAAAA